MTLKNWFNIITPREDLIEGKPLDASEFAVHLDHVRSGKAPADYVNAERFFHRTYLTQNILEMAAQTVRRLSGITTETSPIFNLTTQFGGGKTHALTLLYHLAKCGNRAKSYSGVDRILERAQVDEIPTATDCVFVGTELNSVTGRGEGSEPHRKTPWGDMAFQVGGKEGFKLFEKLDDEFIPPGGDDLNKLFDEDEPYLLLVDELMNYVSKHRRYQNLAAQTYNFMQSLSEFVRSRKNIVLAVSIPASEIEMNPEDREDYNRYQHLLDRLGKAMFMSAERETTEIIRRRLFDWNGMPGDARKTIGEYVTWLQDHKAQIPNWFNIDYAREAFEASYPFHPGVLELFERKWQSLPQFQRTRGVLRLLALWVSKSYNDGYKKNIKESLITLGSAPLEDPNFRAVVFEQLGETRLEAAVTTDIAGKKESHALRLDSEAIESIRKARLHKKCATIILFESNGGQTKESLATVPEIKLSVGEPDLDIGLIDGVLQSLLDSCYYLTAHGNKYKFSTQENLIKRFADRKASIKPNEIDDLILEQVRAVFDKSKSIEIVLFPEKSIQITDRPALVFVILHPSKQMNEKETMKEVEDLLRNYGQSARTYKSGLIFAVAEDDHIMKEEAKKCLAWQAIDDEAGDLKLDSEQQKQIRMNVERARKDLIENVWRAYKSLLLLDKENKIQKKDLGLIHSSQAKSLGELYLSRLIHDGEVTDEINPNYIVRNWSPAFTEWSTKNVRDAFYASPQFPRLTNPDSIKTSIAKGVANSFIAYVGKKGFKYEPFEFGKSISVNDVEISDEMFIIKAEEAKKHIEPRALKSIRIFPSEYIMEPKSTYAFSVKGYDQHGDEIAVDNVQWESTNGEITGNGQLSTGELEGSCKVIVKVNDLNASATVTIMKKGAMPPPTQPKTKQRFSWSGNIAPNKWTVFYTKVLARYAKSPKLKVNVSFEIEDGDVVNDQKIEETKNALRELGLEEK